tara:strand:+ start:1261 stop:1755 length:495 start_codon:yes stop_codon:yes gene_type:complete
MSEWKHFIDKGKQDEKRFAQRHLSDIKWANDQENIHEHWDVQGVLPNQLETWKFDVKGLKKKNRADDKTQDKWAWVEGTNVDGRPGWIKGQADYIVFERDDYWLMVNREELYQFTWKKLEATGFPKGKKAYHVYDRAYWGKKDKITLVPYEDIEELKDVRKLEK